MKKNIFIEITLLIFCIFFPIHMTFGKFKSYEATTVKELPEPSKDIIFGDHIRRTMHLLESSTKENPNKVKILFYGQSITRQNYSRRIIETKLREAYPHAELEVLNPAIGGYTANRSVRTMFHTLIPHQPDLVVFHVYDTPKRGISDYEEILKNIRQFTTAEIICMSHHYDNYNEKVTEQREQASELRRTLAKKYQCEFIEIRKNWSEYMKMHEMSIPDFLTDKIHHNKMGGELWGSIQARHFVTQPANPNDWQDRVARIRFSKDNKDSLSCNLGKVHLQRGDWKLRSSLTTNKKGTSLVLEFEGSRVDAIYGSGKGEAKILINGQSPWEITETWSATLPSKTPIDYRPALMKLEILKPAKPEKWTLTTEKISENGKIFSYHLSGSTIGMQGSGDHRSVFHSKNGMISINPRDFTFDHAIKIKKTPIPTPAEVTWKTYNNSLERWKWNEAKKSPSGQVTLVQQLPVGRHQLKIILEKGELDLEELIIYRPIATK